ncbi:DoxX family membrane protein [Spirosoma endbachense]|uniref:DoxX family membrane protein n=2 Tax=Spirosoma endbachense TaxID=2666025 RepID=A0A6P1VP87_9BACT|nr:DoxX family membrane protein [Spirosoma endbachense]
MKFLLKDQYWPYFLLSARVLLAWTLFHYGWAKLTGSQFGVDEKTMNLPLKEVGLFRLSWYLADHQPFKAFIGISQIGVSLLLVFNRTAIIGAFASIPIWLNILMWDITFMEGMTTAFTFRLSFYLLLTGLILYQSGNKVLPALQSLTENKSSIAYPYWVYLTLPVAAICLEVLGAIPNAILSYAGLLGK